MKFLVTKVYFNGLKGPNYNKLNLTIFFKGYFLILMPIFKIYLQKFCKFNSVSE